MENNAIGIEINTNSFENEQKEIIDYVEINLVLDNKTRIRLKPFDDEARKKLNRELRHRGYKIGVRKENNT